MKKSISPKHRDAVIKPIIFFIVVVGIGYAVITQTSSTAARPSTAIAAGGSGRTTPAPVFTLADVHGSSVTLSEFRGKVVILDFWATWCPPCKKEIPDFISLQQEYALRGVQVIGIGLDEPEKIREFARQYGINYPVLIGNESVSTMYGGIDGIPTTYIIDKQGNIVNRFEGFTERSVFESEVKKLL